MARNTLPENSAEPIPYRVVLSFPAADRLATTLRQMLKRNYRQDGNHWYSQFVLLAELLEAVDPEGGCIRAAAARL